MEIQMFHQGVFFTEVQALENNDKVVSPLASGL